MKTQHPPGVGILGALTVFFVTISSAAPPEIRTDASPLPDEQRGMQSFAPVVERVTTSVVRRT